HENTAACPSSIAAADERDCVQQHKHGQSHPASTAARGNDAVGATCYSYQEQGMPQCTFAPAQPGRSPLQAGAAERAKHQCNVAEVDDVQVAFGAVEAQYVQLPPRHAYGKRYACDHTAPEPIQVIGNA